MERKDYTLEVHKYDRRHKSGSFLVDKYEYRDQTLEWMQEELRELRSGLYPMSKYRLELFETYVKVRNFMTGEDYMERYDQPYTASPRSETYWSS